MVPGVTLGEGPNSLFHEGGTALVIHAKPDDGKTDPTGNAGARVTCGVIIK
jgi:Cu-Zn family superoxide dismutase